MIDTTTNKVLDVCKYYDDIINYDIASFDEISYDLIDWYKDFIFFIYFNNYKEIIII